MRFAYMGFINLYQRSVATWLPVLDFAISSTWFIWSSRWHKSNSLLLATWQPVFAYLCFMG